MILLIVFSIAIGAAFYRLAHDHYRSEWGFAVLGGGVFIGSQFIFGMVLGFVMALTGSYDLLVGSNQILIGIIIYLIAGASCGILYYALKKNWEKNPKKANNKNNNDLLDN